MICKHSSQGAVLREKSWKKGHRKHRENCRNLVGKTGTAGDILVKKFVVKALKKGGHIRDLKQPLFPNLNPSGPNYNKTWILRANYMRIHI